MTVQLAAATQPRSPIRRYLAPAALAALVAAIIVVVVTSPGSSGTRSGSVHATVRNVPPYWTVHPGDTYAQISRKTGLTIDQLEARNPHTDARSLVPGQRLLLWLHPPPPRPKPPGPQFWTVRPGDSFGSIAAKTGVNIIRLERLNPRLKPTTLQPGDRVRLRR